MAWTFGRRLAVGFALSVVMLLLVGGVAYRSIDALMENNGRGFSRADLRSAR